MEDPDGNLWALEFRPVQDMPQRWLVFDSTGALRGAVTMPSHWKVRQIGTDFVAVSLPGDAERVAVYPLVKGTR
jgi:hypothetical protein